MPITIPTAGGPFKRRIIEMAYAKCSMAGYEFGRTPEEINDALSELGAMMLEWPFSLLGYVQPGYGLGGADEQSGIADQWLSVVATQLALRLAPNMGKSLSEEARGAIARSMSLLQASVATIPSQAMQSNTVRGMGARSAFGPFIQESFEDVNTTDEA